KKSKLPMKIEYKNSIKISMPTLKTSINISQKNGSAVINMRDLSKIKRSLKNLPLTLDGGNLKIQTDNYKRYTFQGLLKRYDCFIYEKDSACLTQIPIDGYFSKDNLILKAFQDRFVFNSSTSTVKLNHLNLDLKQYFETVDKDQKNRSDSDSGISQKIKVIAKKSTLRYDTHKLLTDRYDLDILPGGDFYFRGTLGSDAVTVRKRKTKLEIRADRIHDKMLHPLINFDGLQRGRYSVMMSGIPKKKMKGVITLDGGVMSNFKAYNNALAFINTIPALATLNSPGFSSRGFKIKRGTIEFTILNNKKLHFDSVLIEGGSATISGDGVIDLDTKKVNIDLAIQAAKPVGQILGSLPVVGYVLAGEKKSIITIGLHISGTLDNPRVKISPIKDTLTLPFKMIQRTLDIPSKLKNKKR
ncbi:MAG: AsmA-like C-terminal domain-containing protein, partial [Campylobacterota bacterium]|nr:AsmA-like C-terminal domain-containing protein [Campylobacterota bacterium]